MAYLQVYKNFKQNHPMSARFFIVFMVAVLLLLFIRATLPLVIYFSAINWLDSQGLEAEIGDIEISLIEGKFSLADVSAKDQAGVGLSFSSFSIDWQWLPLMERSVIIDQIQLEALQADVLILNNGNMNIAGLDIKKTNDDVQMDVSQQETARPWPITLKKLQLSDLSLCLQQFGKSEKLAIDYCGELAALNWSGDISFKPSDKSQSVDIPLFVSGTLKLKDLVVHNNILDLNLMNTGLIEVNDINIDTIKRVDINNINVLNLSVLSRPDHASDYDAQMFSFDQLDIKTLHLGQLNDLSINEIKLQGSESYFVINKDGSTDIKNWFPESEQSTSIEKNKKPDNSAQSFNLSLDKFTFISKQHFIFVDQSLNEKFVADIHNVDFELKGFDTRKPEQDSRISLALALDKHGSFKIDMLANQLMARPNITGTGKISGFDLRMFSPLAQKHIGHNIRSGQLDVDLKLNIEKGVIDSNMALALHQFELKTLSNEEAEKINSEFGFPLNSSLSLLRGSDNAIRLDIPVTGDYQSPEFEPRDAIVTASSKAISTAALHYYTPFGLVFAAGTLFDLATALNFEPVVFEAGGSELNKSHKTQLDTLISLLNERPGIHLTLCGMANNLDRFNLFPETEKENENDNDNDKSKQKTALLSEAHLIILKKLAESRSSNIKNYMVLSKKVQASRLIECSPEFKPDEVSAVNISI